VLALFNDRDAVGRQMTTQFTFIASVDGDADVVQVSATGNLRARPPAFAQIHIDEINQCTARPQLHHPILGELALDTTAENVDVKRHGPRHSADQQQKMIDCFQFKRWTRLR
jgi:hypothetical protein